MSTTAARRTNVPDYTTAYYFLEGLSEIGIDYLFCNFGTDHAPIINEMAHRKQRGEAMPKVVRCPHENTAAHMAAGYAFVTGRGQGDVLLDAAAISLQQRREPPSDAQIDPRAPVGRIGLP